MTRTPRGPWFLAVSDGGVDHRVYSGSAQASRDSHRLVLASKQGSRGRYSKYSKWNEGKYGSALDAPTQSVYIDN